MGSTPLPRRALGLVVTVISSLAFAAALVIGLAIPSGAATVTKEPSGLVNVANLGLTSSPSRIVPLSASTCSGPVCIYVVGSGLNVSSWTTTVALPKSECSYAKYLENGVVIATSGSVCGPSGDQLESEWSDPGNFPNGTQLCNEWNGISGEPCITVHS
jgi:hypothetical protein